MKLNPQDLEKITDLTREHYNGTHRAIKARCRPMRGFQSFASAAATIAGIELAHRIRKRQFMNQPRDRRVPLDLRREWSVVLMT